MNIFKTIYCRQYQRLLKYYPSPDPKLVRKNANNTLAILFGLLSFMGLAVLMYFAPALEHALQKPLDKVFPPEFEMSIWVLLVVVPTMLAYGILRITWGSESGYQLIIGRFQLLDEAAQKQLVKRGKYLLIGLGITFLLFTVGLFYVALAQAS